MDLSSGAVTSKRSPIRGCSSTQLRVHNHSQANGLAESSVKTAKEILKAAMAKGEDAWLGILAYRNTPTQGRDTTPAQRLFSCRTKTLLPTRSDLLAPDVSHREKHKLDMEQKLSRQKPYYDQTAGEAKDPLATGDKFNKVWLRSQASMGPSANTWSEATVKNKREEPRSFDIETNDGSIVRRNRCDLRRRIVDELDDESDISDGSTGKEEEEGKASQQETLDDREEDTASGRADDHFGLATRSGRRINPPNR